MSWSNETLDMISFTFYKCNWITFNCLVGQGSHARGMAVALGSLDTKREITSLRPPEPESGILTLAELEALASLGATWLLTLDDTRVAGEEAFCTEG